MQRVEVDAFLLEQGFATGHEQRAVVVEKGIEPDSRLVNVFWDPDTRRVLFDFRTPDKDPHLYEARPICVRVVG